MQQTLPRDDPAQERRRAAVVFADVVGFTAMTARNEAAALALWRSFLRSGLRPALVASGGANLRTFGDGALATFATAEDAATYAEALQRAVAEDRLEESQRWPGLSLRVAVNFCEVSFEGDDVLGDGVNMARRLQERAAPDAVLLSEAAREALSAAYDGRLRDLGFLALKGAPAPMRAFELVGPGAAPAGLGRDEAELPSIAVLPFENLGASSEDSFFADGLVEDVIASLAGLQDLVTIARSSTAAFRDERLDPREARRVFGVRYALQGAVRRRGGALRLTANLIDCETGATLFSTRRDFHEASLFDEQDRLVDEIVNNIAPHIRRAELERARRRPAAVFSAYEVFLRALQAMRRIDRDSYEAAGAMLDEAIAGDPNFVAALNWKMCWWSIMVTQGWVEDRGAAGAAAEALGARALAIHDADPVALAWLGHVRGFVLGRHAAALPLHERARRAGPGHAIAWALSSLSFAYNGRGAEAVECARRAAQLSPFDPVFVKSTFLPSPTIRRASTKPRPTGRGAMSPRTRAIFPAFARWPRRWRRSIGWKKPARRRRRCCGCRRVFVSRPMPPSTGSSRRTICRKNGWRISGRPGYRPSPWSYGLFSKGI
jgi:adenylate cyclase